MKGWGLWDEGVPSHERGGGGAAFKGWNVTLHGAGETGLRALKKV